MQTVLLTIGFLFLSLELFSQELVKFEADSKISKFDKDCITVSPDVTKINIVWKDKADAGKGLFEELLTAYRSCNSFEGVDDKGYQIIKEHHPYLLDNERKNRVDTLSFDFVLKTFLHEFEVRRTEKLKNGYEVYTISAPKIK